MSETLITHTHTHTHRWPAIFCFQANSTRPRRTCRGTSKHTAASTRSPRRSASTVARRTWACQPWRCTCWLISWHIAAVSVARCSPGRGCCKAIWEVTRARSRTGARIAAKRSPTGRICAPTCRPTPRTRTTSATSVTNRSHSNPTWTSTWSPPVRGRTTSPTTTQTRPSRLTGVRVTVGASVAATPSSKSLHPFAGISGIWGMTEEIQF